MIQWLCLSLACQILGYFDYAFTSIFTVEILLKVTNKPPVVPPVAPIHSAPTPAAHLSCFYTLLPSLSPHLESSLMSLYLSTDDSVWGLPAPRLFLP